MKIRTQFMEDFLKTFECVCLNHVKTLPEGLRFTRQSKRGVRLGSHSAACPRPVLALQAEISSFRSLMPWRTFSPKPDIQSSPHLSVNAAGLQFSTAEFHGY